MKYTAGHYYAAMYVKAAIKGFLARRMIAPLWRQIQVRARRRWCRRLQREECRPGRHS